jgi:hypothetical protein
MRNFIRMLGFVALITAAGSLFGQNAQKSITITGIPTTYNGMFGMLALSPSTTSTNYTAYSLVRLNGTQAVFQLSDWNTDGPWSGSGNFAITLAIYKDNQAVSNKQTTFEGKTSGLVTINQTSTAVQWSQLAGGAAPAAAQKSITISGIPATYNGMFGMLALSPSTTGTNYAAYSLITLNGASAVFPLSDWNTDGPWSGSGNFSLTLAIYKDNQAVSNKQTTYEGKTGGLIAVNQTSTAVQWPQFLSTSAAPAPAAASGSYIITGSGTTFSASRGGEAVARSVGASLEGVIAAIKTAANGAALTVQFGNGAAVLDIGTANADFSGTGWGVITITGKITTDKKGASPDYSAGSTVRIADGVTAIINADITNTNRDGTALTVGTSAASLNTGVGTVTINGGAILSKGTGNNSGIDAYNSSVITINGGSVSGETYGVSLGNRAVMTVTGGSITGRYASGVNLVNNSNSLTVSGGTIQGTGNRASAIYDVGGGKISISGRNTVITSSAQPGTDTANQRATIQLYNAGSASAVLTIESGVTVTNTGSGGLLIFNRGNRAKITSGISAIPSFTP